MAELRFSYGVMSAGKSTLALQVEHTWTEAGRSGVLLTSNDRGGAGRSTRPVGRTAQTADGIGRRVCPSSCCPRLVCRVTQCRRHSVW